MQQPNAASAAERVMRQLGLQPDSWQLDVLRGNYQRLLLNCCRQAGKSTVVAIHALLQAIYTEDFLVLLLSASHRQSSELFKVVTRFFQLIRSPLKKRRTAEELILSNNSRIVCLPCKEETVRGFANVGLLIIDEASRVPDDLYKAVRPMLAVSNGRLICMSTPHGKQGFFYHEWAEGGADWTRIEVAADRVPRISPAFLESERRSLKEAAFRQEYMCSFEVVEGQVYPDLYKCVCPGPLPREGRRVGGIDFGFRNPFAAIWGVLDPNGILWLSAEHYSRGMPLSHNAGRMPRDVLWYADPHGANEISELRCAGFTVSKGGAAIAPGIAAVTARIQTGRLRIIQGTCPNLLDEAGKYRYSNDPRDRNAEVPIDQHNHALGALRYLVSRIDARKMARPLPESPRREPAPEPAKNENNWLRIDNEALWTTIWP
jgi:hypothetical protein